MPLYRVFEKEVINNTSYSNKFNDAWLATEFTSPSRNTINFFGFFDGNGDGTGDKTTGNDPVTNMNLHTWYEYEQHLDYLNDHDVSVHLFQGFQGKKQYIVDWRALTNAEKDFYIKYVCARMAAFSNIAGWNYAWETGGTSHELDLTDLLIQYDPWDHLRSYHDETPATNNFSHSNYSFAPTENHGYAATKNSRYHHQASLDAYVGKPVYMSEGNGLWHTCWGGTEDTIRRAAWACVTAGASFVWNWESGKCGNTDDPSTMFDSRGDEYIDIVFGVMENDLAAWYTMTVSDHLLSSASTSTYCLAEQGKQYLVYEEAGGSFTLDVGSGYYTKIWVDTKTGLKITSSLYHDGGEKVFTTPDTNTDWVLVLRSALSGGAGLQDAIQVLQICAGILVDMNNLAVTDVDGDRRVGMAEAVYSLQVVSGLKQ